MARKPRFNISGIPQHVVQRGNNREPCFFAENDYSRYLNDLYEAACRNRVAIHAYVLMTNHVHLLATPGQEFGIAHTMQDLGRKYVRYINHCYRRTGTLWEGRYKASLVDSEAYLLTCMRYIEMNPVRASMVNHPGEYRWSSYGGNAQGKIDRILVKHPLYQSLGNTENERNMTYRELFQNHLDDTQVHDIRDALGQELVLGRDDFKDRIEQMLKRQTRTGQSGRPRIAEPASIYYVLQYIRENCDLTPVQTRAIGGGICYAIAARIYNPDSSVFVLMGDGTAGFHLSEFETAIRYGVSFVAVIGNDSRWNAEHQIQLRDYGAQRLIACELGDIRYDEVVRSLGGYGEFVDKPEQLEGALERAMESHLPACINVQIEGLPAPTAARIEG